MADMLKNMFQSRNEFCMQLQLNLSFEELGVVAAVEESLMEN